MPPTTKTQCVARGCARITSAHAIQCDFQVSRCRKMQQPGEKRFSDDELMNTAEGSQHFLNFHCARCKVICTLARDVYRIYRNCVWTKDTRNVMQGAKGWNQFKKESYFDLQCSHCKAKLGAFFPQKNLYKLYYIAQGGKNSLVCSPAPPLRLLAEALSRHQPLDSSDTNPFPRYGNPATEKRDLEKEVAAKLGLDTTRQDVLNLLKERLRDQATKEAHILKQQYEQKLKEMEDNQGAAAVSTQLSSCDTERPPPESPTSEALLGELSSFDTERPPPPQSLVPASTQPSLVLTPMSHVVPASAMAPSVLPSILPVATNPSLESRHWIAYAELAFDVKPLAAGSFGQVYRVTHTKAGSVYAAKVLRVTEAELDEEARDDFSREAALLLSLRHPHVVQCVGVSRGAEGQLVILSEMMLGGGLNVWLYKKPNHAFKACIKLRFAREIASGIAYLHANNVIHRDLKSDNILLDEDGMHAKIADLGVAKVRSAGSVYSQHTAAGSVMYVAPEMLRKEAYGTSVDVYSFALVVFELNTRRRPYTMKQAVDLDAIRAAVVERGERPVMNAEDVVPAAIVSLMQRCWHPDGKQRPRMAEVVAELQAIERP